MLVVLVIIGMLAGLVGPRLLENIDGAKVTTAETQIEMIKGAVMALSLHMERVPTNEEGLALLKIPPIDENLKQFWKGPYLEKDLPLDPWNNSYQYSIPGADNRKFALYSLGADGKLGGSEYDADLGYLPPKSY